MQRLQPQPSDHQKLTPLQAQVDVWGWAGTMHHDRHSELARQLLGCGKMIRVRVRIDEIPDAQTVPRGRREVAIKLPKLGVDQCCGAGFLAADDIGTAPTGGDCFE
jgi:hypothetical protein